MSLVETRRDTAVPAAFTAVVAVLALVLTVRVALGSAQGQRWDESAMKTVVAGRDAQLALLSVLGYVSIGAIVLVTVVVVGVALARGRVTLAVGAVVLIAGANVTTQALKHVVLERPDLGLGTLNSLPSGHTTVVASAVGAAMLVAPAVTRPLVAAAGAFATTLTGASTVVAGWHRPADVVASLAVSVAWTAAVAVAVHSAGRAVRGTFVGAVLGAGTALVFLVAVGVRPLLGWAGFLDAGLVLGVVTAVTALFVGALSVIAPGD